MGFLAWTILILTLLASGAAIGLAFVLCLIPVLDSSQDRKRKRSESAVMVWEGEAFQVTKQAPDPRVHNHGGYQPLLWQAQSLTDPTVVRLGYSRDGAVHNCHARLRIVQTTTMKG